MLLWMDSKQFEDFLNNEKYDDILKSEYVIVSNRIYVKNRDLNNIINAQNILFPYTTVLNHPDDDTIRERYFSQLDNQVVFLACLIQRVLVINCNIIFICTKKEAKIKFMNDLVAYIYLKFGYRVYNYEEIVYCEDIKFHTEREKRKILKTTEKIIEKNIDKSYSKKTLKKILKEYNVDTTDMTKDELEETLAIIEGDDYE